MAIEKRYDGGRHYTLVCDHCGDEAGYFDNFYEAVAEKKNYGFASVKVYGEWHDVCDHCREQEQYRGGVTAGEDFAGWKK